MANFNNFKKNNYKYLDEIDEGLDAYLECKSENRSVRNKGSKSYVIKRIDLLRYELLKIKKALQKD